MDFLPPFGVARARELMRYAANLSLKGLGNSWPNPIVGAILVNQSGEIIGEGFHKRGDHAEIVALKNYQKNNNSPIPEDAYLFITLEPCNHQGKTGPCTHAILEAGIKQVVFAVKDQNSIASGGAEYLTKHGVNVYASFEQEYCEVVNRDWLTKISKGRPRIVAKIASTLDGRIAASDGSSKWITSPTARESVYLLRANSDAVITSTKTVLADDPKLDSHGLSETNPERIVVGTREIPENLQIKSDHGITHFISNRDLTSLVDFLKNKGYNRVMVEAGSEFFTALNKADLIDEIHLYYAPKMLGAGKNFVEDLGIENVAKAQNWLIHETELIGGDLHLTLFCEGDR